MTDYFSIPSNIPINKINIKNGYIYGYDNVRTKDLTGNYNPDNVLRIDQYINKVSCAQEIQKAFSALEIEYIYCNGYNDDPLVAMFVSKTELTQDQQNTLNSVITNHKSNITGDKYSVQKSDGTFVMDQEDPQQLDLFDTSDLAQQYINAEQLTDAIIRPVVIL